jgi:CubicO group peptidase (beta-lactamase class C family)
MTQSSTSRVSQGDCLESFTSVRAAFDRSLANGDDLGASLCVTVDGKPVVDLWGGHIDESGSLPWTRDTIVNVYSTTKTMCGLSALLLADKGELSFDKPVARYWPEFASAGKEQVLVRHILGHTAGLPGWDEPIVEDDLYDWEKVTSLLARQAPWWSPGTASGYHAVTQGFLIGELVKRVTGQTIGAFFAREIAAPLQSDFHIGLPPSRDRDLAPLVAPPALPGDSASGMGARVFRNPYERPEWSRGERWRRAEIPACNGMGNARSIARVQSLLACGGTLDGKTLLSQKGCNAALRVQAHGEDLVVRRDVSFGIGYKLVPERRICQGGGWGGSAVLVDLDHRMVVAYAMNKMLLKVDSDRRLQPFIDAAYEGLTALRNGVPNREGNVHRLEQVH